MSQNKVAAIAMLLVCVLLGEVSAQSFNTLNIVYQKPKMEKVIIKNNLVYKSLDDKKLTFDLYYPPDYKGETNIPVVVIILGYTNVSGKMLKDWTVYKDWAKLFASSGMAVINYGTMNPAADIEDLLTYIREHAAEYNLDKDSIGIWSCSANVLTALTITMAEKREYLKCAALYYGLMLTPDHKFLKTAQNLKKLANFSTEGLEKIKQFHTDLPLLILRAGKDRKEFNQAIDYYISQAIAANIPLTLINYTEGHHAFDVLDDSEKSRDIIQQTVKFYKYHLFSK